MRFLNYKARMNKWMNCREKLCIHAVVTLRSPLSSAYCLSEKERKGDNSLQTRWQGFRRELLNDEDPKGSKHSQRSCLGSTHRVGHDHVCSRTYSGGIHGTRAVWCRWLSDTGISTSGWQGLSGSGGITCHCSHNLFPKHHQFIPFNPRQQAVSTHLSRWQLPLPSLVIYHRQAKSKPKQNQAETNVTL